MEKKNKDFSRFVASIASITSFVLFTFILCTCEIGLGAAVDTDAPNGEITTPVVDSVVRDSFAVAGTWTDDASVQSIKVSLSRTDGYASYGPYPASIETEGAGKGKFSCIIEPTSSSFGILDGIYEVKVELKDEGNHTTELIRQFSIDNTAPLLVLQRPSTIATTSDAETDVFGQHFTLEGQVCDDNAVDHIDVSVYSDDTYSDASFIKTIQLNNVPSTISLDVAVFSSGESNDYAAIYGGTSKDVGKVIRYCKITTYDKAQKYPLDGSNQTADDTKGNATSSYYLYDDISGTGLLGSYKITELYKMINGTYTLSDSSRSTETVTSTVKNLENYQNSKSKFILNPQNNPIFTVSGKTAYTGAYTASQKITNDSTIVIDVAPGLDSYTLKKETLRPYLLPCNASGALTVENSTENRIYLAGAGECEKNGSNYRFTVNLKAGLTSSNGNSTLSTSSCYIFAFEGEDTVGNPVISDGSYVFELEKSSISNTITAQTSFDNVNWTTNEIIYAKENATIYVKGIASGTDDTVTDSISVKFNDSADGVSLTKNASERTVENGSFKQPYTASFNLGNSLTNGTSYKLAVSAGDVNTAVNVVVKYDNEVPKVDFGTPSPMGKIYSETSTDNNQYLNGSNLSLVVRISDNDNVKSASVEFQQKTDENDDSSWVTNSALTQTAEKNFANWALTNIDTTKLEDNKDVRVKVTALDRSGNEKVEYSDTYKVNQASDMPAAMPGDSSLTMEYKSSSVFDDATNTKNKRSAGGSFPFTLYDDDGIASASIEMKNGDDVLASSSLAESDVNKKTATLSLKPSSSVPSGVYPVTLKITDTVENTKTYDDFYVMITASAPKIKVSADKTKITTNATNVENPVNTIAATITITSSESPFKIVRKINGYPADSYVTVKEGLTEATYTDQISFATESAAKVLLGLGESETVKSGEYQVEYKVIDKNNLETSSTFKFYIDNDAPAIGEDITVPNAESTAASTGTFSGKASEKDTAKYQSGLSKVQYKIGDNGTPGEAVGLASWTITLTYENEAELYADGNWKEGNKTIYLRAIDGVGNASQWSAASKTFMFDRNVPEASITDYVDKDGSSNSLSDVSKFYYGYKFSLKGKASDSNALATTNNIELIQKKKGSNDDYSDATETTITSGLSYDSATGGWTFDNLPRKKDDPTTFDSSSSSSNGSSDEASDGIYQYTVKVTDIACKTTTSTAYELFVDHTKPVVNLIAPAKQSENVQVSGATYTFKANLTDVNGSGVKTLYYAITDNSTAPTDLSSYTAETLTPDSDGAGSWSLRKNLATGKASSNLEASSGTLYEGQYYIHLYVVDLAGNKSETTSQGLYIDQAAPKVTLDESAGETSGGYVNAETWNANLGVKLAGTITETNELASFVISRASDAVKTYEIGSENGKISSVPNNQAWTYTDKPLDTDNSSPKDGTYTYSFVAKDKAGKSNTSLEKTVIVDTKAPTVDTSKISIPTTSETESEYYTFTGEAASVADSSPSSGFDRIDFIFTDLAEKPGADVSVSDTTGFSVSPKADGSWTSVVEFASYDVFKTEGTKYLWTKVYDKAGNASVWSLKSFVYDKEIPTVSETVQASNDGNYKNATFKLGGTVSDSYGIKSLVISVADNAGTEKASYDLTNAADGTSSWEKEIKLETGKSGVTGGNDLADGQYTFTITVTDKAGKPNSAVRKLNIDTSLPNTDISVTTEGVSVDTATWYKTKTIKFTASPSDTLSGIQTVSYTTKDKDNRSDGDWTDFTKTTNGSTVSYTGSVTFENDGTENHLYFKVTDNAGNVQGADSDYKPMTFMIDSTGPSDLTVYDDDGNNVTGEIPTAGNSDLELFIDARDAISGVKGVCIGSTYVEDSAVTGAVSDANSKNYGRYKITIPAAKQETGDFVISVADKVGNTATFKPFSFKVDKAAPTIEIKTPSLATGSTSGAVLTDSLNGKVEISVVVTDKLADTSTSADGKLESVDFWYSIADQDASNTTAPAENTDSNTNWYKFGDADTISTTNAKENLSISHKFSSAKQKLEAKDGVLSLADLTEGEMALSQSQVQYVWLKVTAKDTTGHTSNAYRKIKVDRESDRPVVSLTNLTLAETNTSANYVWLENTTQLFGTIDDDDNSPTMQISLDGASWENVSITNKNWVYDIQDFYTSDKESNANGPHTIYFKVKDSEDNEYTSAENSTVTSIKLSDGTRTFGTADSGKGNSILYIKAETLSPEVAITGARLSSSDSSTSTEEFTTSYSSLVVGGENNNFDVKFKASDANGIASVEATALYQKKTDGSTVGSGSLAAKSITAYDSSNNVVDVTSDQLSYCIAHFETSDEIKNSGTDGNIKITIKATDTFGSYTPQTQTLSYDYCNPVIEINSPDSAKWSTGSVTAYGSVNESSTVYYALSFSGETAPSTKTAISSWAGISSDNLATATSGNLSKSYTPTYEEIKDAGLSWYVYFDGVNAGSTGTTHGLILKDFIVNAGVTTDEEINNQNFTTIVKVYLWIKAVDSVGNIQETCKLILVDPQGDRPEVTISYPSTAGDTVGDEVNIYGTATAKNTNVMKYVWLQLVADNHVEKVNSSTFTATSRSFGNTGATSGTSFSITKDDLDYLAAAGYKVYNMKTYYKATTSATLWTLGSSLANGYSASDYGILIETNGSTGWSQKINTKGEFNNSTATVNVGISVYSQDAAGHISQQATQYVKFDANTPVIKDLYLRQYGSDGTTVTATRAYSDEMWVKGTWYLEGLVTDDSKVDTITITSNGTNVSSSATITNGATAAEKTFKYPLATSTGSGQLTFKISADDGSNHVAHKSITINYDNTAPTSGDLTYSPTVENSNGYYEISSTAKEGDGESGVRFIAFYLKKSTNLFDVMLPKDSSAVAASGYTLSATDGLYWKTESISAITGTSVTLSSANANVHKGGLIEIDGAIYVISGVNDTASPTVISVDGTLDSSKTASKVTVKVALANVVDNAIKESANGTKSTTKGYGYGYCQPLNDDGDLMIEYLSTDGDWSARINSRNLPDGNNYELTYVVYDKAGNCSKKTVTGLKVSNNAPRIAGVTIKTDYDGDNKFDSDGEVISKYNAAARSSSSVTSETTSGAGESAVTKYIYDPDENNSLNTKNPLSSSMNVGSSSQGIAVLKGKTEIYPEIVGGNGKLKYSFATTDKDNSAWTASGIEFASGTEDYTVVDYTESGNSPITLQFGDLLKLGEAKDLEQPKEMKFTFTDTTGSSAEEYQSATMNLYFGVNVISSDAPTSTMADLYWKSMTDNSIYGSSTVEKLGDLQGHIELPGDLPTANFTGTSGEMDKDPKVSGKIVFTGSVTDSVRVKEIWFSIPGMAAYTGLTSKEIGETNKVTYYQLASEINGSLTGIDKFDDLGIKLEVKNSYTADNHTATWTLSWDTEKLSPVAKLDLPIKMIAYNQGTPSCQSSTTNDTTYIYKSLDGATYYAEASYSNEKSTEQSEQVDVVPYVTGLRTKMTEMAVSNHSEYGRSALGAYPVYYYSNNRPGKTDKDTITVEGFNITGASVTMQGTSSNTATLSNNQFDLPSGAQSGEVTLSITNGSDTIKTLNNLNNNDSKGTYTYAGTKKGSYAEYKGYYNRQANDTNNDNLTDDLSIMIWDLNAQAVSTGGELTEPVMHINPNKGMVGFAFASGNKYFLPRGTTNSYDYWGVAWNNFNSVGFNFDPEGNSFGVEMGTDSNNNVYSRFRFTSSLWGKMNGNSNKYADPPDTGGDSCSCYTQWNALRLEGMNGVTNRFKSHPKIVATNPNSNTSNVYLMYYDYMNNELKFKAGGIDQTHVFNSTNNRDSNSTSYGTSWGDFSDDATSYSGENATNYAHTGVISSASSTHKPGENYSLAVVAAGAGKNANGDTTSADVAVVVWYDPINSALWYAYMEDPINNNHKNASGASLTTNTPNDRWKATKILENAGGYCAIAVDTDGHVHIAGNTKSSLVYTRLDTYDATFNSSNLVTVDSYGATGYYITLDVAKTSSSAKNATPYITYYSMSLKTPKYAYLVDPTTVSAGADATTKFYTGKWESVYIPTEASINATDNIQIGIYKTTVSETSGVITAIPKQTNSSSNTAKVGTVGGNGTTNPLISYGTTYLGKGYIETAQLK